MANPFTTFRAAEHADTMEGFLSLVVPDPLEQYFERFFHDGVLFRRAMFVFGQPGSGKTTLARLFEPVALATLLRHDSGKTFTAVRAALVRTGAISSGAICIIGARVPLESDFRDLANLPYSAEVRKQLLLRLIQARTVLRWFAQLGHIGVKPESIEVVPRNGCESGLEVLGGSSGVGLLDRARQVERAIYSILGALVAPKEEGFSPDLRLPYNLFDVISEFRVTQELADQHHLEPRLKPFVILDDAHSLSSEQYKALRHWVARREISLGRWILSRLDTLSPSEIASELAVAGDDPGGAPGLSQQRDYDVIQLQGIGEDRQEVRKQFAKIAEAIARRYLKQVEAFNRTQISDLSAILDMKVTPVADKLLIHWKEQIKAEADRRGITREMLTSLEEAAVSMLKKKRRNDNDLFVALTRILVHRRAPIRQLTLFDSEEVEGTPKELDASLLHGAEIHLFRKFGRPYFYGFERLAQASSENPELFVRLSGALVDASLNQLLRKLSPSLSAAEQHRLLVEEAGRIFNQWNFPEASSVRRLIAGIAKRCVVATELPNAYLKSGANAIGISMDDFELLIESKDQLASIIKYGVAYSAFSITRDRSVKNKQWCLLTLGGVACLHFGLTFALGGFVEGTSKELKSMISNS